MEREILVHVVDIMMDFLLSLCYQACQERKSEFIIFNIKALLLKNLKIRSHLTTGFVLLMASAFDNMIRLNHKKKDNRQATNKLYAATCGEREKSLCILLIL